MADGRRQQQPVTTTSGVEGASYPMYPFAMVYQTTNPDQHQAVMTMNSAGAMTTGGGGSGGGGGSNSMGYYASQQQHQHQHQQQQDVFLGHGCAGGINFYDTMTTQSEGLEALVAAQEAVGPPSLAPQPIFVNPKQYERIMKRREARARLENHRKVVAERKPFLHKSRHEHAVKRPRGPGGRFLTKEERIAWDEEQARLEAAVTAAATEGGGGGGGEGSDEEGRRLHKIARTSKPSRATLAPQPVGINPPAPQQQRQQRQHHPSHGHSSSSSSSASFSSSSHPVDKGLKQPPRS